MVHTFTAEAGEAGMMADSPGAVEDRGERGFGKGFAPAVVLG